MLKAIIHRHDEYDLVILEGRVDETVDLKNLMGTDARFLKVNCRKVEDINSCGIRLWKRFFDFLRDRGTSLLFIECSPALVEAFSIFPELAHQSEIESLVVPLQCRACHRDRLTRVRPSELATLSFASIEISCKNCEGVSVFDGDFRAYEALKIRLPKRAAEQTWSVERQAPKTGDLTRLFAVRTMGVRVPVENSA